VLGAAGLTPLNPSAGKPPTPRVLRVRASCAGAGNAENLHTYALSGGREVWCACDTGEPKRQNSGVSRGKPETQSKVLTQATHGQGEATSQHSHRGPVVSWRLQDIVLLEGLCARIIPLLLPPPIRVAHTIALLLHDCCAIYDPPFDPSCVCHTPYNIGNDNIM